MSRAGNKGYIFIFIPPALCSMDIQLECAMNAEWLSQEISHGEVNSLLVLFLE